MKPVSFITTEIGKDLIVSFVIPISDTPGDIESLTLLRTPIFERLLPDAERGVKFMPEKDEEEYMITGVAFDKDSGRVTVTTSNRSYEFEVGGVDPEEIRDMCAVLRQMNFDQRMKLTGI